MIAGIGCTERVSNKISFTILQLNDVYEISPMNKGKVAGLARVATLREQLLVENQNTISVMAGDFLSPSLIGTMKINGQRVSGEHMVETLNALKLDYATFGNHEFDLKETDLINRINQSQFNWTSANSFHQTDSGTFSFEKMGVSIPKYIIHEFKNKNGSVLKLGIISVTLPFNTKKYVKYEDIFNSFSQTFDLIKNDCDVVIGLTHLNLEDDIRLAKKNPDLLMILGGHEHVNSSNIVGKVQVKKADANAKTAYVHRITIDLDSKLKQIESELVAITDSIEEDKDVKAVVDKWNKISNENLNALGYDPDLVIYKTSDTLDILESSIRNGVTNFTKLTMEALAYAAPSTDVQLCNSGSIRLDDILTGNIYQYDILKTFPYGGDLTIMTITGEMLRKTVEISISDNKNTGGYLQMGGVELINDECLVNGKKISDSKTYKVLIPSFVAAGNEKNLEFLKNAPSNKPETLGPNKVKNDIRNIVIDYLAGL